MSGVRGADPGGGEQLPVRTVIPMMRAALLVGAFLVSLAGIQLYVLTTRTDHYFAWTIAVPITAAFLGAFYWTSVPLALLGGMERVWIRARVGVPRVLLFLWATLATTLIHLGKFHLHSPDHFARGAAWLWLATWWPWALTPLTARAMAAWLLGLGGVLAMAFWEDDWIRIRIATISYAVLGILQLAALARYSGSFTWGLAGSLYTAFVVAVLLLGVYGLAQATSALRRLPAPIPRSA